MDWAKNSIERSRTSRQRVPCPALAFRVYIFNMPTVKSLQNQRAVQVTSIISLAAPNGEIPYSQSKDSSALPDDLNPLLPAFLEHTKKQNAHNQECLYRTCAGVTTFRVRDPDPNAVDDGKVLGIRFEAFASGKFLTPYYVFLNKPYAGSQLLRVHRHTFPPCIPLESLAARYLPTPSAGQSLEKIKKQNLSRFVRNLRKETAGYHNRASAVVEMRKSFGLDPKQGTKGKAKELGIRDVSAADAEVRQIRIDWVDGRIGRIVTDAKGNVENCIVLGEDGRDRAVERQVIGGNRRVEEVAQRLLKGA